MRVSESEASTPTPRDEEIVNDLPALYTWLIWGPSRPQLAWAYMQVGATFCATPGISPSRGVLELLEKMLAAKVLSLGRRE